MTGCKEMSFYAIESPSEKCTNKILPQNKKKWTKKKQKKWYYITLDTIVGDDRGVLRGCYKLEADASLSDSCTPGRSSSPSPPTPLPSLRDIGQRISCLHYGHTRTFCIRKTHFHLVKWRRTLPKRWRHTLILKRWRRTVPEKWRRKLPIGSRGAHL